MEKVSQCNLWGKIILNTTEGSESFDSATNGFDKNKK